MAMWVNVMYYVRRPALLIIITRDGNQWVIRLTKVVFRYCYNHGAFHVMLNAYLRKHIN